MNVGAEADAAYVTEKGLQIGPVRLKSWPVETCTRCRRTIRNAPYLSKHSSASFSSVHVVMLVRNRGGLAVPCNVSTVACSCPPNVRASGTAIRHATAMQRPVAMICILHAN